MIVCSCNVISDGDIEAAVIDIMSAPNAPIPTPGVVFRHLNKRMNCCTCAPVAVSSIYAAMDRIALTSRICPFILAEARAKLVRIEERRQQRESVRAGLWAERRDSKRVA